MVSPQGRNKARRQTIVGSGAAVVKLVRLRECVHERRERRWIKMYGMVLQAACFPL
jgi:hypothetical protein